ncbi:GcrA cell cycle regulator [Acidisoma cellulosilytica]|uniref:GcrA cell cycle regulator n=1 Tax=Acidisoma cellulosilyticum TaxID=2802395 RepID=A0A963YXS8_9PROT|nr:GcrA family cell cycle regulator [Acidisoma cellulosilyticum]MCB8879148.1 GcrA cell cycle regulator [Acidisoma cellulosilyticum]
MEWNETIIAELRTLWAEGLSTAEIGRRLGISKNAVVGKAHRLDLSPRPSPIRRNERPQGVQVPAPRVTGPTLAPLPSGPQVVATGAPRIAVAPASVKVSPPRRLAAVAPAPVARISACCWPVGEPGKPGFHFCDGAAVAGKPYCAEHAQLAYVKIRDRREDAA